MASGDKRNTETKITEYTVKALEVFYETWSTQSSTA